MDECKMKYVQSDSKLCMHLGKMNSAGLEFGWNF